MRLRHFVLGLYSALCATSTAQALDFSAIPVVPVRTGVFLGLTDGHYECGDGSSTSSVTHSFSIGTVTGQIQATVSASSAGADVHLVGSTAGGAISVRALGYVEFDVAIPELGDAMTPLLVTIEDVSQGGSGWEPPTITLSNAALRTNPCSYPNALPWSAQLGIGLGYWPDPSGVAFYAANPTSFPPGHSSNVQLYPAGDTVRLHLQAAVDLSSKTSAASFDDSFRIAVKSSAPALGNGDLNGDRQVDILDSTILRRKLAGLPTD